MTPCHLRLDQSCVCGCLRPAREHGGYSTACWMALSPAQRAIVQGEQPTDPIDSLEIAYRLPSYGGEAA